mmetsp:Transcript_14802/g.58062  ORF Transcript_14802/g.58062 Transcript_14802/m.58062 type:complete len:431 (+) Transcript_14802:640-1932(+)|eukprot:CAMPEP_0114605458 /NCGR_PEP_ID=MMETSP0168-20121206/1065_1 /TAXON_ID=95228 ORGANISM="Vannella sp., Strain DIVA3 517/6/12" /NCGR_SAMPLE_ID=MMETSP0168 /ASSEMBLY_ACC=CAM_ASM_000044 /LENGTH=430 /DNA_ID=CAMNT_0001816309 /DNA_START=574 /DNA_END=1866 /DNA_ORIENTATION=-
MERSGDAATGPGVELQRLVGPSDSFVGVEAPCRTVVSRPEKLFFNFLWVFAVTGKTDGSEATTWRSLVSQVARSVFFWCFVSFGAWKVGHDGLRELNANGITALFGWDSAGCAVFPPGHCNPHALCLFVWWFMYGTLGIMCFGVVVGAIRVGRSGIIQRCTSTLTEKDTKILFVKYLLYVAVCSVLVATIPTAALLVSARSFRATAVVGVVFGYVLVVIGSPVFLLPVLGAFCLPIACLNGEMAVLAERFTNTTKGALSHKCIEKLVLGHANVMELKATASDSWQTPLTLALSSGVMMAFFSVWATYLSGFLENSALVIVGVLVLLTFLTNMTIIPTSNKKLARSVVRYRGLYADPVGRGGVDCSCDELEFLRMLTHLDGLLLYLSQSDPYWRFWIPIDSSVVNSIIGIALGLGVALSPVIVNWASGCFS